MDNLTKTQKELVNLFLETERNPDYIATKLEKDLSLKSRKKRKVSTKYLIHRITKSIKKQSIK